MKILFLTSPAPESGWAYTYAVGKHGEKRFPLGLGYLVSVLREKGLNPDFIDLDCYLRVFCLYEVI